MSASRRIVTSVAAHMARTKQTKRKPRDQRDGKGKWKVCTAQFVCDILSIHPRPSKSGRVCKSEPFLCSFFFLYQGAKRRREEADREKDGKQGEGYPDLVRENALFEKYYKVRLVMPLQAYLPGTPTLIIVHKTAHLSWISYRFSWSIIYVLAKVGILLFSNSTSRYSLSCLFKRTRHA